MVLYYFVLLCLVGLGAASREIPSYIHICKRNDPEVARCIRESVEVLKPRLKNGIPELNVPPLEPLALNDIDVFGPETPSLNLILKNMKVHGASDFKITKLKANVDKHTYRVGLKFDKMSFDGDFDVDARIIVPLKGTGKFLVDIADVDGQAVVKAEIVNHNGHRQYKWNSLTLKIQVKDYKIDIDSPITNDATVRRAIDTLVQENKAEIIQRALPIVEKKTREVVLNIANKIVDDLDYDEVFPEK